MRYRSLAFLALLAALACSDEGSRLPSEPTESPDQAAAAKLSSSDQARLADQLAGHIAKTLRSADMRALVRDAMRRSPVTEHKLVLQDFALTAEGKRFVSRVGDVAQVGAAQVNAWIKSLPRLDFYMPAREHRLAWRGGADAAVVAHLSATPPQKAHAVSGGSIGIRLSATTPSTTALFMLQREEFKNKRIRPQRDVPGSAIQDPDDGELGITYIETDRFGRATVTEVADVTSAGRGGGVGANQECNPDNGSCGGGGGGGGTGVVRTYLKRIDTFQVCDNADCSQGNEFEFYARASTGLTKTTRITGIRSTAQTLRNDELMGNNPIGVGTITIATKETDAPFGDDIWDYVTYEPNYQGPIPLTRYDNNRWWYLKERPSNVFEDYRVGLFIAW
jgi:hypothetical protein